MNNLKEFIRTTIDGVINSLDSFADELNVSNILVYILAALLAITVGVFGYNIIKLICAFALEPFAFSVGAALYTFLITKLSWDLPKFVYYVFAIAFAILFCYLCFKRFNLIFFAIAYVAVSNILLSVTEDATLATGGALLIALLCVSMLRVSAVVFTSFAGSFLTVALCGKVLTGLKFLQIATNDVAIYVALGAGVLFAIVQFVFARYYKAR
jgi:hypothetical protein